MFFSVFCCFINVKGIVHPKIKIILSVDSVMAFYFYTIIYSKIVLNLSEFLSSAECKCYFEEQGKPNSLLILCDFHIFPSIKVNVDQQLFGYPDSPKYRILCSAQEINEYRFGTT